MSSEYLVYISSLFLQWASKSLSKWNRHELLIRGDVEKPMGSLLSTVQSSIIRFGLQHPSQDTGLNFRKEFF